MNLLPEVSEEEVILSTAIQQLLAVSQQNEYGFPLGIYRPDMLPLHDYLPDSQAVDTLFGLDFDRESDSEVIGADDGSPLLLEHGDTDGHDEDAQTAAEGSDSDADTDSEDKPTNYSYSQPVASGPSRIAGFQARDLEPATVALGFDEGFPTLPDGRPVWDRFSYETFDQYIAFQAYLELPTVNGGVRMLRDLAQTLEENELLEIGEWQYEQYTAKFQTISHIYYWNLRARAYDIFKSAAHRKKMEMQSLQVQDSHFDVSSRLLTRLLTYMEDEEDFWEMMSPKVGIDFLKTLTQMQRVSSGLPATTPATATKGGEGNGGGMPFEMILRTISQQGQKVIDGDALAQDNGENQLASRILQDPDATRLAQELILRVGSRDS